jgi:hypothetical protein
MSAGRTWASEGQAMAERVLLHVGLMKSGTTFIQGRLNANRDRLAEQGILFPGPSWARHARAVSDLIGSKHAEEGAWASLAEELRAHPGTAIVSMEYLGPISAERIRQVRDDLADSPVEAVVTVRDLGRSVPAMWQETLKNRQSWGWTEYLGALEDGGDAGRRFWRQQAADRVVGRWAEVLGPENVHVVTVPPPGAPGELLWERFCEVAGITGTEWDEAPRANESLGVASALLMGRINELVGDLALPEYNKKIKALGKHVLVHRRRDEEPIGFTVPRWLRKRSAGMVAGIEASGARVVGDLRELEPLDVPGADPASVDAQAQLDAAVAALVHVLREGGIKRPGQGGKNRGKNQGGKKNRRRGKGRDAGQ